jgi:hypothetical protein
MPDAGIRLPSAFKSTLGGQLRFFTAKTKTASDRKAVDTLRDAAEPR